MGISGGLWVDVVSSILLTWVVLYVKVNYFLLRRYEKIHITNIINTSGIKVSYWLVIRFLSTKSRKDILRK